MNRDDDRQTRLDEAVEQLRSSSLARDEVDRLARRAWERITADGDTAGATAFEPIAGCAGFRELLEAWRAGRLSPDRRLLVDDHLAECVACRHAARVRDDPAPSPAPLAPARRHRRRVATIAATVAAAALIGVLGWTWFRPGLSGGVRVAAVDGALYRIAERPAAARLSPGAEIAVGEVIRTAPDSTAQVRLDDGSLIELGPRAEVSVSRDERGATIHLGRGDVIVEAARQRDRRLYVATDDCLVRVKGTVFSVSSGAKGSRVSVIEGEVHVDAGGEQALLQPGDQFSTSDQLEPRSLEDEIAWSRRVDEHLALLRELVDVGKAVRSTVRPPALRHESSLLDLVSPRTMVFAAVPNLSRNLVEAYSVIESRVDLSPALSAWWEQNVRRHGVEPLLREAMARLGRLGGALGDEVVLTVGPSASPDRAPWITAMSEVTDARALRRELGRALEDELADSETEVPLHLVADPANPGSADGEGLWLWISEELVVASTRPAEISRIARTLGGPAAEDWRSSEFHRLVDQAYGSGAGWLVAADFQQLLRLARGGVSPEDASAVDEWLELLGASELHFGLTERKTVGEVTSHSAMLAFDGQRRGLAGLLAEPGPLGGLDFVSSDASFAVAALLQRPEDLLEQFSDFVVELRATGARDEQRQLAQSLELARRVAASMGSEVVVALDGPLLPVPAWKLVLEVNDPSSFLDGLRGMVDWINSRGGDEPLLALDLAQEATGASGVLRILPLGVDLHFALTDGYFVAAPQAGLVTQAVRARESGLNLARSPALHEALPPDGENGFSALVYESLAGRFGPLLSALGTRSGKLNREQRAMLRRLGADTPPSVVYVYAEPRRIRVGQSSPAGALDAATLANLAMAIDLPQLLGASP